MVRSQRRRGLAGVELRTVFDSSRRYWFYATGFEFFVPITWRGEIRHQQRREMIEPGSILVAYPGDVFASKRVLEAGSWHSLMIEANALLDYCGARAAWEQVRLRPFARMSPHLESLVQAVVQSLQSDYIDCVRANLRSFLTAVASELAEPAPTPLPPAQAQAPAPVSPLLRPTPLGPPYASPRD
jgi:hypothetical protein